MKWPQNDTKMTLKWHNYDTIKTFSPKRHKNDTKMTWKWHLKKDTKMTQKWHENDTIKTKNGVKWRILLQSNNAMSHELICISTTSTSMFRNNLLRTVVPVGDVGFSEVDQDAVVFATFAPDLVQQVAVIAHQPGQGTVAWHAIYWSSESWQLTIA